MAVQGKLTELHRLADHSNIRSEIEGRHRHITERNAQKCASLLYINVYKCISAIKIVDSNLEPRRMNILERLTLLITCNVGFMKGFSGASKP